MKIYLYHKCSTCKNALKFLKENEISATVIEITETPPSRQELEKMLQHYQGQVRKLFNTSGQLYRAMQLSEKLDAMPLEEAFKLLSNNGMLVKRPFLIGKEVCLVGFNEREWSDALL